MTWQKIVEWSCDRLDFVEGQKVFVRISTSFLFYFIFALKRDFNRNTVKASPSLTVFYQRWTTSLKSLFLKLGSKVWWMPTLRTILEVFVTPDGQTDDNVLKMIFKALFCSIWVLSKPNHVYIIRA